MSSGVTFTRSNSVGLYWPELGDLGESWSDYQKSVKKEKQDFLNSYLSKSADGARGVRRLKSVSVDFGATAKFTRTQNSYDFAHIQRILQAYDMPQLAPLQDLDSGDLTPIVEAAQFQMAGSSVGSLEQLEKQQLMKRSQSMRSSKIPFVTFEDKSTKVSTQEELQEAVMPQTSNLLIKACKGRSLSRHLSDLVQPKQHDQDWSKQLEQSMGIDFKKDILNRNK
eukprot:TRINITY_DN2793_c0_g1_i2.p3 TRINITY_DN2793_c0_g1~~TRINITY_DN2793_c0_g1_i2.p3  ORF type:complete len:224 (+),score=40.84 TRINITY_DN2793_c0_g1_i2:181-852(+)